VLVDEVALFGMLEHGAEQRLAFLRRHVDDADGHQPVDVDRFAAGVLVGAKDRMAAFGESRCAAAVAALGRAVIVVVHRLAALEPAAERRIEGVIGGIAAREQRIAPGRRNFHGVEQGRLARYLGVDHVVVKHQYRRGNVPQHS
jgi:phage shock protein PspC (stress-responsive transcriptional regulator)